MKLRMLINFLFIIIVYSVFSFYIAWNGWIWLHTAFGLEDTWIYGLIVGIISYSYVIGHFLKRVPLFKIIGSYWLGLFQYAILFLPLANLVAFILDFAGLLSTTVIICIGAVVLAIFILLFSYGTFNAYNPIVRSFSIVIPKCVNDRSHLKIAMASDMHFGRLSGLAHVRRLVREVNKLKPDIILLPGDIIDDDPEPFLQKKMGDVLQKLSAPLGVFGVLGNHEYYGGEIPRFLKEMERIGISILLDQVILIDNLFYLAGRKDKTDINRLSIENLLADIDPSFPLIMMDHQPAEIKQAEKHHVDLLLSGHTHRGQMAPNHLITRRIFELDWGYLQKNQLHTIVSSGFGFWGPPLRIGSRSEIIQIDITFS
ncbi:metallophosphoesterase [Neobacillus sp.]|uniref:metallophosphoesterase n=1 Tax=Neobacillus sp. TaxID=2675273 RepID=UPI00289B980E|nr:metallophosphoesterase [Neobacillus sp.]